MGGICGKQTNNQKSTGHVILQEVTERVVDRKGSLLSVESRYHRGRKITDDYQLEKDVLGTGYSGHVKLAKNKATGKKHAVKTLKIKGVSKSKLRELEAETEIFLTMDHPHVACLQDVYEMDSKLHFVMELLEGGELFDRLMEKNHYSEFDAAQATHEMLLAVNYLHAHKIVHRDLKLENFLYESKTGSHLKLIDFGFSKLFNPNSKMAQSCGTLSYISPEVLAGSYTEKCDLWSLGVIVFMLLSGKAPFYGPDDEETVKVIKKCKYKMPPAQWGSISEKAKDFVKALLVLDPVRRLSAHQSLEHPWISQREEMMNAHIKPEILQALQQFSKASHFRRACMMVMSFSMSMEHRDDVRKSFLALDPENTGIIKLAALKDVLKDHDSISGEVVAELLETLHHTAHDQEISYHDYLAAVAHSRVTLHQDEVRETFRRFDTNGTGYITADNLRQVLGGSFEGTDVEDLIREADTDGDGHIDYDEFLQYLSEGPGEDHLEPVEEGAEPESPPPVSSTTMKSIKSVKSVKHEKICEMISKVVDSAGGQNEELKVESVSKENL
eukprot:gnl/MRDRNA2_/MRDRNA2_123128_c0_seq1.p1 gnl/MRDRNA2_/MRDRNA2_123128_c0~~gnl/MRDRNA2_/MRDRNA2_123128_c0_seq1.p1  ORF type:complete len:556 (-),score=128.16 gnl/MRDRNA2_/MRDRNA2_123128_c0_seq1:3-1670(-)